MLSHTLSLVVTESLDTRMPECMVARALLVRFTGYFLNASHEDVVDCMQEMPECMVAVYEESLAALVRQLRRNTALDRTYNPVRDRALVMNMFRLQAQFAAEIAEIMELSRAW